MPLLSVLVPEIDNVGGTSPPADAVESRLCGGVHKGSQAVIVETVSFHHINDGKPGREIVFKISFSIFG